MPQQFHNNWASSIQSGIDAVTTTINVPPADAALISDASATNWYYLTLDDQANIEVVMVTAANGTTGDLTVVRGQDGTSGAAFSSGTLIENRVTAGTLDAFQNMPDTHADNSVPRGDGADSKKLQSSGVYIGDDNELYGHGAGIRTVSGTTDTILATDSGKVIACTSATAVTLTLPQQSTTTLPQGFQLAIVQRGAGQVTVAVEGSDTIESKGSYTKLTGQHSSATVILLVAGSPNTWGLYGDLSA